MKNLSLLLAGMFMYTILFAQEQHVYRIQLDKKYLGKETTFFESETYLNAQKILHFTIKQSYPKAKTPELYLLYDITTIANLEEMQKAFLQTGDVEKIKECEKLKPLSCSNPVNINDSAYLKWSDCNALDLIEARCAWSITTGNPNIIVGIADTEFETIHEDLIGKFVSVTGIASDYVHGTAIAGLVTAQPNNDKGIAGIGYNTRVAGYQSTGVNLSNMIWEAYLDGRPIINVSWNGTNLDSLEAQEIINSGIVLVVSAGNDNEYDSAYAKRPPYHSEIANIPGVIIVSSVNRDNMHGPTKHAHNQYVDICAPGVKVHTTFPNNYYDNSTGTSLSAPIVSGTIALMLAVNPNLKPARIEELLKASADPIADGHLFPGKLGAGRVNAYKAVLAAQATISSTISGPGMLCQTSGTYIVNNLQGRSVNWNVSNAFRILNISTNASTSTITIERVNLMATTASIEANIGNGEHWLTKVIDMCPTSISGGLSVRLFQKTSFTWSNLPHNRLYTFYYTVPGWNNYGQTTWTNNMTFPGLKTGSIAVNFAIAENGIDLPVMQETKYITVQEPLVYILGPASMMAGRTGIFHMVGGDADLVNCTWSAGDFLQIQDGASSTSSTIRCNVPDYFSFYPSRVSLSYRGSSSLVSTPVYSASVDVGLEGGYNYYVFPNPTSGTINLAAKENAAFTPIIAAATSLTEQQSMTSYKQEITETSEFSYQIYNQSNSFLIKTGRIKGRNPSINLHNLPDGFYLLKILLSDGATETHRIVVKH